MSKVLVVDDKQMMRDSVTTTLARAGFTTVAADNGESALAMITRHRPAAVVTDLKMPNMDGLELLTRIGRIDPDLPVILMTAYATVETAVSALKQGAFDYIQKPFEGDELVATVRRAVRHHQLANENAALKQNTRAVQLPRKLVGDSSAMAQVRKQIEQVAASHGTVLISGESGTGKEIIAQSIHQLSPRRDQIMLCLNCAALSDSLLESELFGHEKGAFTGADQMRKGRFELADGGTLLLDEISEISPTVQAKLLRVLQERQFERVGSSATREVDVRIIATTNRQLEQAVASGQFRQDLYFRLNVLPVQLPPLRARRGDIPALAEHFLLRQAMRDGRETKAFDAEALDLLSSYDWPGNVRELENICERAAVLTAGNVIAAGTIQPWITPAPGSSNGTDAAVDSEHTIDVHCKTLEELEREVIIRTLGQYDGHRQRTAEALGIAVRTLGLKLKKWKEDNLVASSL
ncbi:sigma-54-dependent Fis family transcriptional regulator [Planctomycetales bacterium ZRK34]|nr:sigma-54-dependent Fis family transcriptional regulator [Planctomycetales bacterium ZRK34]